MINKKIKRLYSKIIILIICLIISLRLFTLVLSKYESISNSNAIVEIAFYLFKEDYKNMTTHLSAIYPKDGVYVYTFSIGNENEFERAEVDLEYDLKIRTTTNLPLIYKLYMNEDYSLPKSTNIIKDTIVEKDENGTYFKKIITEPIFLNYKVGTTNTYQLVVEFPITYNQEIYQDIIEMIEISVDAKQVIDKGHI